MMMTWALVWTILALTLIAASCLMVMFWGGMVRMVGERNAWRFMIVTAFSANISAIMLACS